MQLHEKISLMRKIKGWSQEKIAEKLNMSINGYSKIERGETDVQLSRLENIARIFGIKLLDLINFDDNKILNFSSSYGDSHDNNFNNYINNQNSKSFEYEIEKMSLIIEHKNQEIFHLRKELEQSEQIINLLKKNS